jgi:hypothetical protein
MKFHLVTLTIVTVNYACVIMITIIYLMLLVFWLVGH